jgi:hypothetical protein
MTNTAVQLGVTLNCKPAQSRYLHSFNKVQISIENCGEWIKRTPKLSGDVMLEQPRAHPNSTNTAQHLIIQRRNKEALNSSDVVDSPACAFLVIKVLVGCTLKQPRVPFKLLDR